MRQLVFHAKGWEDFAYWAQNDRPLTKRLLRLINETLRDPFEGVGKPEPLKHSMPGAWSRRITEEHRLVYLVDSDDLVVLQARYHY